MSENINPSSTPSGPDYSWSQPPAATANLQPNAPAEPLSEQPVQHRQRGGIHPAVACIAMFTSGVVMTVAAYTVVDALKPIDDTKDQSGTYVATAACEYDSVLDTNQDINGLVATHQGPGIDTIELVCKDEQFGNILHLNELVEGTPASGIHLTEEDGYRYYTFKLDYLFSGEAPEFQLDSALSNPLPPQEVTVNMRGDTFTITGVEINPI